MDLSYYVVTDINYEMNIIKGISMEWCPSCNIDCQDFMNMRNTTSGVYHVTPEGTFRGYDVYCDMETDGGGWLVILH